MYYELFIFIFYEAIAHMLAIAYLFMPQILVIENDIIIDYLLFAFSIIPLLR